MMKDGDIFLTLGALDLRLTQACDEDFDGLMLSLGSLFKGDPGPPGDAGPGAGPIQTLIGTAGETLGGHRAVGLDTTGRFTYCDNSIRFDAFRACGITTGAASTDADVTVQTQGELTESGWSWTPDLPIYLGANGQLTQIAPTGSPLFNIPFGVALTATSMFVRLGIPTFLS